MAVLTVGAGAAYKTIAAAIAASKSGDTVSVNKGTYVNDFVSIKHSLVLTAPGGATLVSTVPAPNGKAIITAGASGINVTISGFDVSGAKVKDANGAAVRYEGGNLTLKNVNFHHNQNGLLAASDPKGTIAIIDSVFFKNGTGTGTTHNIYVNNVAKFTVEGSTITGSVVGHQVKSRAVSTTITNNTIGDGNGGNGSYAIDLPNGGVGVIANNVIQKGPGAKNPSAIAFGAEGNLHAVSKLTVQDNTIVNTFASPSASAVKNFSSAPMSVSGNDLFGWVHVVIGPGNATGNTVLPKNPLAGGLLPPPVTPPITPPVEPPPVVPPPVVPPPVMPPPVEPPPVVVPPPPTPPRPVEPPPVQPPPVVPPPEPPPPVEPPPVVAPPVEPPPVMPPPVVRPPPTRPVDPPPISRPGSGGDDDGTVEVPSWPSRPVFSPSPQAPTPQPPAAPPVAQPRAPAAAMEPEPASLLSDLVPQPAAAGAGAAPETPPGLAPLPDTGAAGTHWTAALPANPHPIAGPGET
jgi:hypothetical protein